MKKRTKAPSGARYRIYCNFSDEVLCPAEAIERAFYERARPDTADVFITLDGKECVPTFLSSWAERGDGEMDSVCERWGVTFSEMRSMWFDRLRVRGNMDAWHLIRLEEKKA